MDTQAQMTKWVACWGNATSITDRKECVYAKNITLRYPVRMCFSGCALRLRLSNLTGTETVILSKVVLGRMHNGQYECYPIVCRGESVVRIPAGKEVQTDVLPIAITAGETVDVNLYIDDCTQMNAGTVVTGPLSKARYGYGDFCSMAEWPKEYSRDTNVFYFLNTIDILTTQNNRALVCYGDSITAQSWPDYLTIELWNRGVRDVSVIRRAVCGTRILRQYDCITYQAYGLKGATRFPIEINTAGAYAVLIQHGINDIIHPVGVEQNPFRPWSDMPSLSDLTEGVTHLYVKYARTLGLKVLAGTLLPIYGWRTYTSEREQLRQQFNDWLRISTLFDACVDFDGALRDDANPLKFADGYDSGDHLHPSEAGYRAMAVAAANWCAAID